MIKKYVLLIFASAILIALASCGNNNAEKKNDVATEQFPAKENTVKAENKDITAAFSKPERISTQQFKEKVFDYKKNTQWKFVGNEPCVIDFYADWCRPCRIVAPVFEGLAKDYAGKVRFYKVNTDFEQELSSYFGIRSIPTFMFCPINGDPELYAGVLSEDEFKKIISRLFAEQITSK